MREMSVLAALAHAGSRLKRPRKATMPMNAHAAARLRAKKRARSSAAAEQTDGTASSAQRRRDAPSSSAAAGAAPKAKRMRTAAPKDLGWKSIVLPAELGFDDDGGLLELDEVEGVDVVYEDGRVAFKVRDYTFSIFPT